MSTARGKGKQGKQCRGLASAASGTMLSSRHSSPITDSVEDSTHPAQISGVQCEGIGLQTPDITGCSVRAQGWVQVYSWSEMVDHRSTPESGFRSSTARLMVSLLTNAPDYGLPSAWGHALTNNEFDYLWTFFLSFFFKEDMSPFLIFFLRFIY